MTFKKKFASAAPAARPPAPSRTPADDKRTFDMRPKPTDDRRRDDPRNRPPQHVDPAVTDPLEEITAERGE